MTGIIIIILIYIQKKNVVPNGCSYVNFVLVQCIDLGEMVIIMFLMVDLVIIIKTLKVK